MRPMRIGKRKGGGQYCAGLPLTYHPLFEGISGNKSGDSFGAVAGGSPLEHLAGETSQEPHCGGDKAGVLNARSNTGGVGAAPRTQPFPPDSPGSYWGDRTRRAPNRGRRNACT